MTSIEFQALKPGDVVVHCGSGEGYIVVGPTRGLLLATRVVAISNPEYWNKTPEETLVLQRAIRGPVEETDQSPVQAQKIARITTTVLRNTTQAALINEIQKLYNMIDELYAKKGST